MTGGLGPLCGRELAQLSPRDLAPVHHGVTLGRRKFHPIGAKARAAARSSLLIGGAGEAVPLGGHGGMAYFAPSPRDNIGPARGTNIPAAERSSPATVGPDGL